MTRQFVTLMHLLFCFNFWSLNLSLLQPCLSILLYAVLLREMEIISRVELFDCVIANFLGHDRTVWFPLLTERRFAEVETSVIGLVVILCLRSFVLQIGYKSL